MTWTEMDGKAPGGLVKDRDPEFPRGEALAKSEEGVAGDGQHLFPILHGLQDCRLLPPGLWCASLYALCSPFLTGSCTASRVRPQAVAAVPRVLAA